MKSRIAIFISFIFLGIIVLSFHAYAVNNTFSVYGHIQYENGTSIPGTIIRLIEPIMNTQPWFGYNEPAIQSAVTDSKGDFQFVNITTNYGICGLDIEYPANQHPANPQYAFPQSEIDNVNTTGIQYVNITRVAAPIPENPELPSSSSSSSGIYIIIGLGAVCLFGLFCLYKALRHKK